jgi:hypothetical protein
MPKATYGSTLGIPYLGKDLPVVVGPARYALIVNAFQSLMTAIKLQTKFCRLKVWREIVLGPIYMTMKISKGFLSAVLLVFSFSSFAAASTVPETPRLTAEIHPDEAKKKHKHVETPEPATWLYILSAAVLVVMLERKSIKAAFSSN